MMSKCLNTTILLKLLHPLPPTNFEFRICHQDVANKMFSDCFEHSKIPQFRLNLLGFLT